jgi:dTDP-4-amino-4,6-dideoxygalactose transaminase
MYIPLVDVKAQYLTIKKEIDDAISAIIEGATFVGGKEVVQFEESFAKYLQANYCIGVNSGTDALILGIRALGLNPGDEVIVPVNTFIATALGVSENGLKPVFVDVDSKDNGIDLSDLQKKITSKTKAIVVVHLYGQPDKLDDIKNIIHASGKEIQIIEDACQSHGAMYKGIKVGTFGIFSAFSFYPGKNLGAYGDGGAIVTNDSGIAERVKLLREYGQKEKYVHDSLGVNSRLDTMQAAILRVKLQHLEDWNEKRRKIAKKYTEEFQRVLPKIVETPRVFDDRTSVYHLYVIKVDKRDQLLKYLNEKGIQALIHYPIPLHLQKAYGYLGYTNGDFPNGEKQAKQILSLPIYPELADEQITYIIQTIKEFYDTKS